MRRFLPLLGVLASGILFGIATTRYPGGYDWSHQSISSLFQPKALNHAPNSARSVAALAVVVFAISMAVVFNTIARRGPTPMHGNVRYGFLHFVQKLAHVSWVVWLSGLYLGDSQSVAGSARHFRVDEGSDAD